MTNNEKKLTCKELGLKYQRLEGECVMDLESQVCSLELAKQLKDLGVEQKSLYIWVDCGGGELCWELKEHDGRWVDPRRSAFTVAELGVLLPNGCETWCEYGTTWYVSSGEEFDPYVDADTEANARAKFLIWHLTKDKDCSGISYNGTSCADFFTCRDAWVANISDCMGCREEGSEIGSESPDNVNHPEHYTAGGIETIDFIEAKGLSYHLGNAVKYIARAGKKDPATLIQDLEKACWYLDRAIQNDGDSNG